MTNYVSWLRPAVFAVFAAACIFGGGIAHAVGTDAGTSVQNTFTLDYEVNSVAQTQITNDGIGGNPAPTAFTVDRLVNVTVTSQGDLSVTPNAQDQDLVFAVRNDGNDNQAYSLALENLAGDDFDPTGVTVAYFVDDGDGLYEPGADDGAGTAYTAGSGTATADIAPDAILWVVITGDIPGTVTNGQSADIALLADSLNPAASLDPGYTATPGNQTVAEVGVNNVTGEAQNVLADVTGTATADANTDGAHSDTASYNVGAADLTASKTVSVLATDGAAFGCGNFANTQINASQYAAPGACVEYVITVSNGAGASQNATNIDVSDFLPDGITFVDAQTTGDLSGNGTFTEPAANCTPDSVGPPVVSCEVRVDNAVLTPGQSGTIQIRALVSS